MADRQARQGGDEAINPDHPDTSSEPGTGGLMPGNYEQSGGEAGHAPGQGTALEPHVRAPGSRVPDPTQHPEARQQALDIANGGHAAPDSAS